MKIRKKHKKIKQACTSCCTTPKKWYQERLFITVIILSILLFISYITPELKTFYQSFLSYLKLMWLPISVGFLIGGVIDYFIPKEYIEKYLSRTRKRTVLYAVMFGFLMTACCHGILAIGIELYHKGASTSAIVAFFLASPWANLPITILLFGFFGWNALFIVVSAILIAINTGLIFQMLERRGLVECKHCELMADKPEHNNFSIKADIKRRINQFNFNKDNIFVATKGTLSGSWRLTKMVLWWILIGMSMASLIRYIPHHIFHQYMGPTLLGLFVTLLFATIIEVCSEGTSPIAFEIYNQTGAFGNSFTFLMAGVATDFTEIGLIWHNIGRKAALFMPLISIPQILFLAYLFNVFL
jgi:uncharacterized protein